MSKIPKGVSFSSSLGNLELPQPATPQQQIDFQFLLKYLETRFSSFELELQGMDTKLNELKTDIGSIQTTLNGSDGLVTRLAVVESQKEADSKNDAKWQVILGLGISIATLAIMVFKLNGEG